MIDDLKVEAIFPTPLWIVDLTAEVYRQMNTDLIKDISRLTEPLPALGANGTWQTDPILHEYEEFGKLISVLSDAVRGALAFLKIEYQDFEITGCWANINPYGGLNSIHNHPNNYISGVYYVSVPEGTGKIEFTDPRMGPGSILPPVKEWSRFTCTKVMVDAKEGRIVLFPSWLKHSVPINRTHEKRISISFNIMFRNFTETMSKPLWSMGSAPVASQGRRKLGMKA